MERKTRKKRKGKRKGRNNQDEWEQIMEEEKRKILKELRKEKHVSYCSHDSCKSQVKNFVPIMTKDIGHILDLTPVGEKRKQSLKRLTLTSHTFMGRTM